MHDFLIEDYHQRFEESQNNVKFRNTLVSILVSSWLSLLGYGRVINQPLIIFLSPFFLFIGTYSYLHFLRANIRIAEYMICLEERIRAFWNYCSPQQLIRPVQGRNGRTFWMETRSIVAKREIISARYFYGILALAITFSWITLFSLEDFCLNSFYVRPYHGLLYIFLTIVYSCFTILVICREYKKYMNAINIAHEKHFEV